MSSGPGTWVDPYTFNFQRRDSKILFCDPVSELDHSVAWPEILYGINSLFGGVVHVDTVYNAATPSPRVPGVH